MQLALNLYLSFSNGYNLAFLTCVACLVLHTLYAFVWLRTEEFTKLTVYEPLSVPSVFPLPSPFPRPCVCVVR